MAALVIRPAHDDFGRSRELTTFLRSLDAQVYEVAASGGHPLLRHALLTRPLVSVVALHRLVGAVADLVDGDLDNMRSETEPWATAIAQVQL